MRSVIAIDNAHQYIVLTENWGQIVKHVYILTGSFPLMNPESKPGG